MREGQWPQQDAVDDGEDRGVGADAESERGDRDGREAARAQQGAQCITSILSQLTQPLGAALLAFVSHVHSPHVLLRELDVTELSLRLGPGALGAHATPDELLGAHLEMKAQLGFDVLEHLGSRTPWKAEEGTTGWR